MGIFSSSNEKEARHSGILGAFSVDNIKWEPGNDAEASLIVKKFPYEDFPNGSYLTVAPSQMAVFINNLSTGSSLDEEGNGGTAQIEVFKGGTKIKLETGDSRFAPFKNVAHKLTGGESAFHSLVYFVNTTYMNDLTWGTRTPILLDDPVEEVTVHIRANGMFAIHIEGMDPTISSVNARKFIQKVVGTRDQYTREEFIDFMRQQVLREVPNLLGDTMDNQKVGILQINSHINDLSDAIKVKLSDKFAEFGVTLDDFSFHGITPLEEDLEEIKQIKIQKRQAKFEAERMTIESEALASKRAREGYTYQQEKGFEVMGEAASNEGSGSGMMTAGMGLGMGFGMGGAMGQGIAGIANQTLGAMNNPAPNTAATGAGMMAGAGMVANATAATIACPGCKAPIPAASKFCPECGQKMITECPNCKTSVAPGTKFCPECGTSLI